MRLMKGTLIGMGLTLSIPTVAEIRSLREIIDLSQAQVAGTGCRDATVSSVDLEENVIALVAENHGAGEVLNGKSFARQNCVISAPFALPQGLKLKATGNLILTDLSLHKSASAVVSSEVFLAGQRGELLEEKIVGPTKSGSAHFLVDKIESECGQSGLLRTNVSLRAENTKQKSGEIRLDRIIQQIEVVACEE